MKSFASFTKHLGFLLLVLNFFGNPCQAQPDQDSLETNFEVTAFIKGQQHALYVDHSQLKKGFELQLSDTTYKVEGFRMGWSDTKNGNTYAWIRGARVKGKSKDYNLFTAYAEDLGDVPGGRQMLGFDEIIVRKGEQRYYIPAFMVLIGTPQRVKEYYAVNTRNKVFIEGLKDQFVVPDSIFQDGISLNLADSTYRITGFKISFSNLEGQVQKEIYFKGNSIDSNHPDYQEAMDNLDKKYAVTILVDAEKDGIRKMLPPLSVEAWNFDYLKSTRFALHYALGYFAF